MGKKEEKTMDTIRVLVLTTPQVVAVDNALEVVVVVQTMDLDFNYIAPMFLCSKDVPSVGTEVHPRFYQGRTKELVYLY
jgi:hypothetical protein